MVFRVDLRAWRSWEGCTFGPFQLLIREIVTWLLYTVKRGHQRL